MCGFIRRVTDSDAVKALLDTIGIEVSVVSGGDFRPQTLIKDLIIADQGTPRTVDAMWWYALKKSDGQWRPNADLTTFNARNLDGRMYAEPIRSRRGIVVANAIGESNPASNSQSGRKTPQRYLMESKEAMLLGAIYQCWQTENGPIYSVAIITRPVHERFAVYHKKSTPLFLPADKSFVDRWLDPELSTHPALDDLLASPKLFYPLQITEVKTYKRGEVLGAMSILPADRDMAS